MHVTEKKTTARRATKPAAGPRTRTTKTVTAAAVPLDVPAAATAPASHQRPRTATGVRRRATASRAVAPVAPAVVPVDASPGDDLQASRVVTHDDIRVRAYFLALEHRGRGGSLDYWLQAERELLAGVTGD
ncbi:MAG: DUF2934 domain-containing protein [Vicinamibacterales bacterium]